MGLNRDILVEQSAHVLDCYSGDKDAVDVALFVIASNLKNYYIDFLKHVIEDGPIHISTVTDHAPRYGLSNLGCVTSVVYKGTSGYVMATDRGNHVFNTYTEISKTS